MVSMRVRDGVLCITPAVVVTLGVRKGAYNIDVNNMFEVMVGLLDFIKYSNLSASFKHA